VDFWRGSSLKVRRAFAFRQPSLDGPRRDLCPRAKAQLPQNIAHMPFGGSFAEHQEISNLPARFALSNKCCYFVFTSC